MPEDARSADPLEWILTPSRPVRRCLPSYSREMWNGGARRSGSAWLIKTHDGIGFSATSTTVDGFTVSCRTLAKTSRLGSLGPGLHNMVRRREPRPSGHIARPLHARKSSSQAPARSGRTHNSARPEPRPVCPPCRFRTRHGPDARRQEHGPRRQPQDRARVSARCVQRVCPLRSIRADKHCPPQADPIHRIIIVAD